MRCPTTVLGALVVLVTGCDEPLTRPPQQQPGLKTAPAAALPREPSSDDEPWAGARWTNSQVPYVIDMNGDWFMQNPCANDNEIMQQLQIDAIIAAITQIEALTPLDFVEKTAADPPDANQEYILYRSSPGGSSVTLTRGMPTDGRGGNCVFINFAPNPITQRFLALHETCHALGLAHEQQRPDRDEHLVYDPDCAGDPGGKIFGMDENGLTLTPYDFSSVMQYGSEAGCDTAMADDCEHIDTNGVSTCAQPPLLKKEMCTPTTDPPDETDCRWIGGPNTDLSVHDVNALMRMYERPLGVNEPGDAFGKAFAVGDFDGDRYLDLAVGAPDNGDDNGAVLLWKGTAGSKDGTLGRLVAWKVFRASDFVPAAILPYSKGRFGAALAAGDFDGDGDTDLAVGAPLPDDADNAGDTDDGSVFIYTSQPADGGTPRLTLSFHELVNQATLGLGPGDSDDRFGAALAAGDFDSDGKTDLAIGAPRMRVQSMSRVSITKGGVTSWTFSTTNRRSGAVVIRPAASPYSGSVLTPAKVPGGTVLEGARFGAALAAGKLNGDGRTDLAVGSPERVTSPRRSGAVYLFVSTGTGLVGKQLLRPSNEASDKGYDFGEALALGNFDGSGTPQLAVGAPKQGYRPRRVISGGFSPGSTEEAGAIHLFKPASTATPFPFSELGKFYQDTPTAYNHLGGVLLTLPGSCGDAACASGGDGLVAGLPDASDEKGAIKIFSISLSSPTDPTQINVPVSTAVTAGNRIGEALAAGNFLPGNAFGAPGRTELVVGQPGWSEGAGSFYVRNFDGTGDSLWTLFSQETAAPE